MISQNPGNHWRTILARPNFVDGRLKALCLGPEPLNYEQWGSIIFQTSESPLVGPEFIHIDVPVCQRTCWLSSTILGKTHTKEAIMYPRNYAHCNNSLLLEHFFPVGKNVEKGVVQVYHTFDMASDSLVLLHEGFCHQVQFHWFCSWPKLLQWAHAQKGPNWKSQKARRDDFVLSGEPWIFPADGSTLSPSWSVGRWWVGGRGQCGGGQAEVAWVLHQGPDWEPPQASD